MDVTLETEGIIYTAEAALTYAYKHTHFMLMACSLVLKFEEFLVFILDELPTQLRKHRKKNSYGDDVLMNTILN